MSNDFNRQVALSHAIEMVKIGELNTEQVEEYARIWAKFLDGEDPQTTERQVEYFQDEDPWEYRTFARIVPGQVGNVDCWYNYSEDRRPFEPGWLSEEYVRNHFQPCSRSDVPAPFQL